MQKTAYTLRSLADLVGAELRGKEDYLIDNLADIQGAGPTAISFVSNKAYRHYLDSTAAGAVLLREELAADYKGNALVVADPYSSYARLSGLFEKRPRPQEGIHPTAVVAESATIAPSASVGPHCVVEEDAVVEDEAELMAGVYVGARSRVGKQTRLYPQVTLYHDVSVGTKCTIHSATVIGSDGFGFAPTKDGWEKIYQLGGVTIGDSVEIGSGCTIDRGALSDTEIARGVIIDNQVHLAHNVKVGEFTAIAGCCGVAGSTQIGARCLLGGGVLINGHLTIADGVQFNGATVVTKSIREAGVYSSGTPVQPARQWQKNAVRFSQLNEMYDRLKLVEQTAVANSAVDGEQKS